MDFECRDPIFVTLSSASNLDQYPENRHDSFTNSLAYSITNRENLPYFVQLYSVQVTTKLSAEQEGYPNYLKVNIYETQGQIEGREYSHFVDGFPFGPNHAGPGQNHIYHVFENSPVVRLRFQELRSLHVGITDVNDEPVHFQKDAFPTLLWLKIGQNMDEGENFTITCLSGGHSDVFPANSLASFVVPLPKELDLTDFEVAMLHMIYPVGMTDEGSAKLLIDKYIFTYYLSEFDFTANLIRKINTDVTKMLHGDVEVRKVHNEAEAREVGVPVGRVFIRRRRGARAVPYNFRINKSMLKALGGASSTTVPNKLSVGDVIPFDYAPNLFAATPMPTAIVECSIVKPNIVASRRAQVLQLVPVVTHRHGDIFGVTSTLVSPKQLVWQSVIERPFNTIGFRWTDIDGGNRVFRVENAEDNPMTVVLIFRRKKIMSDN